jgi:serine/threonine protein kinase
VSLSLGTIPRMPLADGQRFAGYKILRLLGSGGMGEVYLAQHPRLPRTDALKVLGADVSANAEYHARFGREADLASTLWHPHIVGVHDRGDDDGQLWISMDYVDGVDAAHLLAEKFPNGMPARQVVKIVTAVAHALDYAHDRGLLHRDIKPANVMITSDEQRILLTDFGIARSITDVSSLTATGFTMGTVAYSAPEQLTGKDLDGRADQYALAATAYHLLSGAQLFPHSNPAVVIGRHLSTAPTPLADTQPELAALDPVLATALAKNPNDRFRRCTDFANALALAPSKPVTGRSNRAASPTLPTADHTEPAPCWPKATAADPTAASPLSTAEQVPTRLATPADVSQHSRLLKSPGTLPKVSKEALSQNFGSRGRRPITVGLALLVVVVLAFVVRPWQWLATSRQSHSPASPTTTAQPIPFDSMRAFVEDYYADLPDDPTNAWKKVDTQWQNKTGWQDFQSFWATIQVVKLVSVSPRDATSVVARVRYFPHEAQPSTEDRWLRMTLVNGAMLLDGSGRIGTVDEPTTAAPTARAPSAIIDNVLLTAAELTTLLGTNVTDNPAGNGMGALTMSSSSYGTADHSGQVKPPSCVGIAFAGEHDVYGDKDFQAIKTQTFSNSSSSAGPDTLQQTAAVFPSADVAQKFLTATQTRWSSCGNSEVDVTLGFENGRGFRVGSVRKHDDLITISIADNGGLNGAHACQQALGAHANVVVEVRACDVPASVSNPTIPADPRWAAADAARLADAILAKVN